MKIPEYIQKCYKPLYAQILASTPIIILSYIISSSTSILF